MFRLGVPPQFSPPVGDLDGEVDTAINEQAEAFEVGEEGLDVGQFVGADMAGAAAHVVGVAELPEGPGLRGRIPVLLAEGARTHGAQLSELGFGGGQLRLPPAELRIIHAGRSLRPEAAESSRR